MRFARNALGQVIGLFVADWRQTIGIALILVAGMVTTRALGQLPIGFAIALGLAAHLVYGTVSEARRRGRSL